MKRKSLSKSIIIISLVATLAIAIPFISGCLPGPAPTAPAAPVSPAQPEEPAAPAPEPAAPLEPIKVGVAALVTGALAEDGKDYVNMYKFVRDEINAAGGLLGRPVELVIVDVGNNTPPELIAARDELIAADVDVVMSAWWLNPAGVQYMLEVDVFMLNEGWVSADWRSWWEVRDRYPYYVTMNYGEASYGKPYFEALTNPEMVPYEFPNNKVAIMFSDWDYAIRQSGWFGEQAESQGWEIVMSEVHPINSVEFGPQMLKIREEEPAIIYLSSIFPAEIIAVFTDFLEAPTRSLFAITWGAEKPEFREAFGELADGVTGTLAALKFHTDQYRGDNPNYQAMDERGRYLEEELVRIYGTTTNIISPIAADQFYVWAEAVERAGDVRDFDAILEELLSGSYLGATGRYGFDRETQAGFYGIDNIPINYYQVQGGNLVTLALGAATDVELLNDFIVPQWIRAMDE